jgi:hypothetical protein
MTEQDRALLRAFIDVTVDIRSCHMRLRPLTRYIVWHTISDLHLTLIEEPAVWETNEA